MGIPTAETHPIAYADMQYCQQKLGTRFVMHADASHYRHQFTIDGVDYDLSQNKDDEAMAAYAKWIVNQVLEPGLDGVDVDWEGWSRLRSGKVDKGTWQVFLVPKANNRTSCLSLTISVEHHRQTSYLIVIISFNKLIVIRSGS